MLKWLLIVWSNTQMVLIVVCHKDFPVHVTTSQLPAFICFLWKCISNKNLPSDQWSVIIYLLKSNTPIKDWWKKNTPTNDRWKIILQQRFPVPVTASHLQQDLSVSVEIYFAQIWFFFTSPAQIWIYHDIPSGSCRHWNFGFFCWWNVTIQKHQHSNRGFTQSPQLWLLLNQPKPGASKQVGKWVILYNENMWDGKWSIFTKWERTLNLTFRYRQRCVCQF